MMSGLIRRADSFRLALSFLTVLPVGLASPPRELAPARAYFPLVGLLLGWHPCAAGQLLVDGQPLDGPRLTALRRATAWVDPAVRLWNRSVLDNVCYGSGVGGLAAGAALRGADLADIIEQSPKKE